MKFGDAIERIARIAGRTTGVASIGALISAGMLTPLSIFLGGVSSLLLTFARYGWPLFFPWLLQSEILEDQTPDYDKLRKQLKSKDQVIMAAFAINGKPFVAIAVHSDSGTYQSLLVKGEAMRPEHIAQVADNHQVIFTVGSWNNQDV
jgi:hypothetical protein